MMRPLGLTPTRQQKRSSPIWLYLLFLSSIFLSGCFESCSPEVDSEDLQSGTDSTGQDRDWLPASMADVGFRGSILTAVSELPESHDDTCTGAVLIDPRFYPLSSRRGSEGPGSPSSNTDGVRDVQNLTHLYGLTLCKNVTQVQAWNSLGEFRWMVPATSHQLTPADVEDRLGSAPASCQSLHLLEFENPLRGGNPAGAVPSDGGSAHLAVTVPDLEPRPLWGLRLEERQPKDSPQSTEEAAHSSLTPLPMRTLIRPLVQPGNWSSEPLGQGSTAGFPLVFESQTAPVPRHPRGTPVFRQRSQGDLHAIGFVLGDTQAASEPGGKLYRGWQILPFWSCKDRLFEALYDRQSLARRDSSTK